MPEKDQSPASEPHDDPARPRGNAEPPAHPAPPPPPPPPAMSSLSEVRDYMDWLENQQPPVSHTRARGIVVAIIAIVLALALLLIFWWR